VKFFIARKSAHLAVTHCGEFWTPATRPTRAFDIRARVRTRKGERTKTERAKGTRAMKTQVRITCDGHKDHGTIARSLATRRPNPAGGFEYVLDGRSNADDAIANHRRAWDCSARMVIAAE
jgi:hypothetical protein